MGNPVGNSEFGIRNSEFKTRSKSRFAQSPALSTQPSCCSFLPGAGQDCDSFRNGSAVMQDGVSGPLSSPSSAANRRWKAGPGLAEKFADRGSARAADATPRRGTKNRRLRASLQLGKRGGLSGGHLDFEGVAEGLFSQSAAGQARPDPVIRHRSFRPSWRPGSAISLSLCPDASAFFQSACQNRVNEMNRVPDQLIFRPGNGPKDITSVTVDTHEVNAFYCRSAPKSQPF